MKQKILILGGTQFVGRVFVEELGKTYPDAEVTLFNRGKTNQDLFPDYKKIIGDRYTKDILKLTEEYWDIVIDFSCYHPQSLRLLLPELLVKVGRYIFISTVSVYDGAKALGRNDDVTENFDLLPYTSEMENTELLQYYGNKKAECERILLSYESLDAIILRPSIIYGRYNHYERIYYWLYRIKNHSEAILPGGGLVKQSHTFVDDFAKMILAAMKVKKHRKVYNANSFMPTSLVDILGEIKSLFQSSIHLANVSLDYLLEDEKMKYSIPMYSILANQRYSNKKIRTDFNLEFESIHDSFGKTIDYYESIGKNNEGNVGLGIHKEKAILFGYFLDQDLFEPTKKLLSEDCRYIIGKDVLVGVDAICNSYESNMIAGRKKMDVLEWGKSRIEDLNEREFYVHFTDYLTHNSCKYTHRCQQKLTLNDEALIVKIEHIHDDEEQKRLDAFYQSVGIK